jgi:glycerol kinase
MLCDQPAALLGTGCLAPGEAKCTYGTGAFLQVNVGASPPPVADPTDGLLRSVAWDLDGRTTFLVEGSVLAAGDVLTWLRDGLGMIARPEEIDDVLARTPDAGGVAFLPALTGLGAPRWAGDARGTVLGLHRGTRREHLIRAALEGVAHQVADVLEAVLALRDGALEPLWADGGLSSSDAFLALQADVAGHALRRAPSLEATTRGVGAVALVRAGLAASVAEVCRVDPARVVEPAMDAQARSHARARHARLVDLAVSRAALSINR